MHTVIVLFCLISYITERWLRHTYSQWQTKERCKGDSISIKYPWLCSQRESKCTAMTQPLICENITGSGGTVSSNRMHHRNNHLIYEAEESPLTWFHSNLACTCPMLFWNAYSFLKTLWLPTAFTSCNSSCYFCCSFFPPKKVFFLPSFPINWQPGKTHFANKILKHFRNGESNQCID